MNIGISNNRHCAPNFGNLTFVEEGLRKAVNDHCLDLGGLDNRGYLKNTIKRAEKSPNTDLIIDKNGRVFIGCKEGQFRKPSGGFTELDGNSYTSPLVDEKNNQYQLKLEYKNPEDAEKIHDTIYAGQPINYQTAVLYNAIDDGINYTITPVSKTDAE